MEMCDLKIYLDYTLSNNEFCFSVSAKEHEKRLEKVVDFIKRKLHKNQKIIVIGHGCGYSREIYRSVLCELKNNGHSFKAIMPAPFSFEGKRRLRTHQETFEFLKEQGISVDIFDND